MPVFGLNDVDDRTAPHTFEARWCADDPFSDELPSEWFDRIAIESEHLVESNWRELDGFWLTRIDSVLDEAGDIIDTPPSSPSKPE